MKYTITSKNEYHQTMVDVFELMNKGEHALSEVELAKLSAMAMAVEKYEKDVRIPS